MNAALGSRRTVLLGNTLRRFLRRGARSKLSKVLSKERPEDVAIALDVLTPAEQFTIFRLLIDEFPDGATQVLTELEPARRAAILEQLPPEQVARLLELLAVDDAVFLVETLPESLKAKVLEMVDLHDRLNDVQEHLTYRDDSAGRLMDTELVALSEGTTVAEAIAQVRAIAHDVDMISYLYVVDGNGHLLGVTSLRQLLLSEPEAPLGDIMNASLIKVHVDTDQEEVAQLAARYDLLAIPVTDDENKLVGIVTVDDILDIIKYEATEDFFKMAGTSDDELVYEERTFKVAGIRLPWLLVNLVGLLGAGLVTRNFEETFQLAILVGFIPVIMGMAGNIGAQTSTIAVRSLATGRLDPRQGRIGTFVWQQIKIGAVLALTLSSIVAVVALLFDRNPYMALAVGASLFATVLLASLNGALVPVIFQRFGIDPAVASGPLVTTTNDVLGILIYFGFASVFINLI